MTALAVLRDEMQALAYERARALRPLEQRQAAELEAAHPGARARLEHQHRKEWLAVRAPFSARMHALLDQEQALRAPSSTHSDAAVLSASEILRRWRERLQD